MLRSAFVLPLRWEVGAVDSPLLPPKLRTLAGQVREQLVRHQALAPSSTAPERWGLVLATEEFEPVDFSDLHRFEWNSGWAPLAAGLITGSYGATPDPRVWASAAWQNDSIQPVTDLAAKQAEAAEHGARFFYMPESNKDSAEDVKSQLTCGRIREGQADVRAALQDYLAALNLPPGLEADKHLRSHYYLALSDPEAARRYFINTCLPEIVEQNRTRLAQQTSVMPRQLVTVASHATELIPLAVTTLGVERCLVLYTPGFTDRAAEAVSLCSNMPCEMTTACFSGDGSANMSESLQAAVDQWYDPTGGPRVFDLTPGRKDLTLALAIEISTVEDYLLYCYHEFDDHVRRAKPFTHHLRFLRLPSVAKATNV
jgi:hypothetical protein